MAFCTEAWSSGHWGQYRRSEKVRQGLRKVPSSLPASCSSTKPSLIYVPDGADQLPHFGSFSHFPPGSVPQRGPVSAGFSHLLRPAWLSPRMQACMAPVLARLGCLLWGLKQDATPSQVFCFLLKHDHPVVVEHPGAALWSSCFRLPRTRLLAFARPSSRDSPCLWCGFWTS